MCIRDSPRSRSPSRGVRDRGAPRADRGRHRAGRWAAARARGGDRPSAKGAGLSRRHGGAGPHRRHGGGCGPARHRPRAVHPAGPGGMLLPGDLLPEPVSRGGVAVSGGRTECVRRPGARTAGRPGAGGDEGPAGVGRRPASAQLAFPADRPTGEPLPGPLGESGGPGFRAGPGSTGGSGGRPVRARLPRTGPPGAGVRAAGFAGGAGGDGGVAAGGRPRRDPLAPGRSDAGAGPGA